MGLQEWLKDVGSGVTDIFTAPLGLIYDTARAMTSSDYNPGFFGTFGKSTEQLVGGMGKLGNALGANWAGTRLGESRVGAPLRTLIREAELLYSTEFQRQENDPGFIGGAFGLAPGTASFQRAAATPLGMAGSVVGGIQQGLQGDLSGAAGSFGQTVDLFRQWEKAATRTPGQAFIEEAVIPDFYTRTPQEQDKIRETAWYNLTTGTIDAVGRWYTDPGVIAGKTWKWSRNKYMTFHLDDAMPSTIQRADNHFDSVRKMGYELGDELEPVGGARVTELKPGQHDKVYAVVRTSQARKLVDEGPLAKIDVDTSSAPDNPRYSGSNHRPLTLHGAGDIDEVKRYAAALNDIDPKDKPIILEIDADGLPVIYEDFDVPVFPGKGDVDPTVASFFTLAEMLPEGKITQVLSDTTDLDITNYLDGNAPSYLEPSGKMNPRMFDPEGRPIEPDQAIDFEGFREDLWTVLDLNRVDAEKFLIARQRQRNGAQAQSDNFVENASNHRTVQSYLNWMDGKSADDIRRVLFPHNPYGGVLSVWLADAKTYRDRRTILLATMGHKDPNIQVLEPIMQAKLNKLLDTQEAIQAGKPPDEFFYSMIGGNGKYRDIPTEFMSDFADELLAEIDDQMALNHFLDRISDMAPVSQLRMPVLRRGTNAMRKTNFYQQTSMSRPIRSVVEFRPHRFISHNDPHTDIQIRRQLEEARPLGIGADEVAKFSEDYNRSTTPQQRIATVERMNDRIVQAAADKAGLTKPQFEALLQESRRGQLAAGRMIESRRYAPGGRDKVRFVDEITGEVVELVLPILETQLEGWTVLPNVLEINRMATRMGRFNERHGYVPRELLKNFHAMWKPTVLLRGGWMLRVVSDEQLRILATMGSLLKHIAAIGVGDDVSFTGALFQKSKPGQQITGGQRTAEALSFASGTRPLTALAQKAAKATTVVGEKLGLLDPEYMAFIREAGVEPLVSARASYGGSNESTLHSLQALVGRDEFQILDHLYNKGTGQWMTIERGDPQFGSAWGRVLKDQMGRSVISKRLAQEVEIQRLPNGKLDDVGYEALYTNMKKWFQESAEGKQVVANLPWRGTNLDRWIDDLVEMHRDYTAGFDEALTRGIIEQKIDPDMLNAIDEAARPDTIHAEIIDQTINDGNVVNRFIGDFISNSFDLMGRLPTDTLSRQPFFREIYAREMARLHRGSLAQGLPIDETAIQRMSGSARQLAIREVRDLLYDLAETSRFGDMADAVMPFYPAWQEVFKVWARIAAEDPSVLARASILWKAPNRAGLVYTDDEGQEFIQFRLSEQTSRNLGLTGWQKYLAEGGVMFGKSSFNLVLNNPLPGVGPLIQMPVNEVVKRRPEFEESLRFLLPFGVSVNTSQILLSPLIRQLKSEVEGAQADSSYTRAFADALTWMDVEYRAGRRSVPPTEEEAHDIASKLWNLRLFTRLAAPSQPIFNSPLKPYIDIYRDMQDNLGPENAAESFLNQYGDEFFAVTLSRTVSKTGIPPTVEAELARREFEELINQYPEYGRLIIGDEALGEFSTGAFAAQLERPLDPDNPWSEMERTYRPTELDPRTGTIIEVDRRLGWQDYIQAMDIIDLERKRLGLPNLRVAAAEPLAKAKQAVTQFIAQKYPSWWDDFNSRDDLKWPERMDALNAIANNPVSASRPDIQGLNDYLLARQAILGELNRRKMLGGSSTLESLANQDLETLWQTVLTQILDDNIAFGPLYFRYLEGDPVSLR